MGMGVRGMGLRRETVTWGVIGVISGLGMAMAAQLLVAPGKRLVPRRCAAATFRAPPARMATPTPLPGRPGRAGEQARPSPAEAWK